MWQMLSKIMSKNCQLRQFFPNALAIGRGSYCDRGERSYDSEESETERVSRIRFAWRFWSYRTKKRPMVRVNKWTAKKKNNIPSFVFHPRSKKITALNTNNLIFISLLSVSSVFNALIKYRLLKYYRLLRWAALIFFGSEPAVHRPLLSLKGHAVNLLSISKISVSKS